MNKMKTKGEKLAQKLGNMAPNELEPWKYRRILSNLGYIAADYDDSVGCRAVSKGSAPQNVGFVAYKLKELIKNPIAIVGKGITFDTGGYSLKPDKGMVGMKFDMMGSAVALGAEIDSGDLSNLNTYLCISENRVSDRALLPESVLKYPDGTAVVVEDTDAEGRLVLADGILLAKKHKAKAIVTVATLTGACVAALGEHTVGAFCTNEEHWEKVKKAFNDADIGVWRLPFLEDEAKKVWKRPGGVISNYTYGSKVPGASYAASFLKHFAGKTPLIHLDIAGVADKNHKARVDMVKILTKLVKLL